MPVMETETLEEVSEKLKEIDDIHNKYKWHLLAEDKKHTVCGQLIDDTWKLGGCINFSGDPCPCCIKGKMDNV